MDLRNIVDNKSARFEKEKFKMNAKVASHIPLILFFFIIVSLIHFTSALGHAGRGCGPGLACNSSQHHPLDPDGHSRAMAHRLNVIDITEAAALSSVLL